MTLARVTATPQGTLPASDIWHSSSGRKCTLKHRTGGNCARRAWKGAPEDGLARSPLAGDNKNVAIPKQHSNKRCMNTAVLLEMVSGCVSGWGTVRTAVRDGCS